MLLILLMHAFCNWYFNVNFRSLILVSWYHPKLTIKLEIFKNTAKVMSYADGNCMLAPFLLLVLAWLQKHQRDPVDTPLFSAVADILL